MPSPKKDTADYTAMVSGLVVWRWRRCENIYFAANNKQEDDVSGNGGFMQSCERFLLQRE